MRIFLMGATGFIGRQLTAYLLESGHEPLVLSRSREKVASLPQGARTVLGDPVQPSTWKDELADAAAVVNLTGRNIMARWSRQVKQEIYDSRIESTQAVVQALAEVSGEKPALVNASAVGYYPDQDQQVHDENSGPGNNFLARVCVDWENTAREAETYGARVVRTRIAPVLGADSPMLKKVLPIFRKGLGGRLGSGRQGFPWIHVQDLVRALEFCISNQDIQGAVNCCAPQIIDNLTFTKTLGTLLGRPAIAPVPGFMIKLAYGELSEMLVHGPKVKPRVLQEHGFEFSFPDIESALRDILYPN